MKKRILWLGEASYLNTGFAIYGKEVLNRLHQTQKYEIAELANYGHWSDPRRFDIPWQYYGVMPDNKIQEHEYNADVINQFGKYKFEDTCLDFKPDIICSPLDWWMNSYIEFSPFRKHFRLILMPTIDSVPQKPEWLATYRDADAILTYSEFGRDYLQENNIDTNLVASPAANYNIFQPVPNKKEHRTQLGVESDTFIIGTVMRNQPRKLLPDLIASFSEFCQKHESSAKKAYLYIHTSYPDKGWNIPELIKEHNIGHRIIFTYICKNCKHFFPSFFADASQWCPKCHTPKARLPNIQDGVSELQLAQIYNLFDIYVQYANCEGCGMPLLEAASCGIPIMAVNYSAMQSNLKNIGGYFINVQRFYKECESGCYRALPDNQDFIRQLVKFISLPEHLKTKKSLETTHNVRSQYSYDKAASCWESTIDSLDTTTPWNSPANIKHPNLNIPSGLNNHQFITWIITNVLQEPSWISKYFAMKMLKDLNYGCSISGTGGKYFNEMSTLGRQSIYPPFGYQEAINEILTIVEKYNYWEQKRIGRIKTSIPEFIINSKKTSV